MYITRREEGYCKICFYAVADTDVDVSSTKAKVVTKVCTSKV